MQDRPPQRQRRAAHVPAANVECPGERCRRGQHRRVRPVPRQLRAHRFQLVGMRHARMLHRLGHHLRHRLGRTIRPRRIDRVLANRHQLRPGLGRCGRQRGHIIRAHQARIIANLLALQALLRQPAKRAGVRNAHHLEQRRVGLVARLQRVAPIGKQHGPLRKHEGRAERAGKPAHPGEALIRVWQVFVLIFIVMGHVEAIEAQARKFTAKQRKMGPAVLRPALDVECLSHAPS